MELQRGACFLCRNVKVISTAHDAKEAYQIISSLFSKNVLNVAEFNNIQSSLKLCPVCYHKLLILKSIGNNVGTTNSEDDASRDSCLLCKSGKILFNVTDWQRFDKASEDLAAVKSDQCIVCSDCLFYLDGRYEVKSKLFSKYPQVSKSRNEITNKKKRNEHNGSISDGITAHSTPISKGSSRRDRGGTSLPISKRTRRQETPIEIISISDDEDSPKKKGINFNSLKGLKPLKHNKIFRGNKIVKVDSKFLNQIPYVLLKTSNSRGHKNLSTVNSKIVPAKTVQIESKKVTTPKNRRLSSRSMIIKRTLNKHVIVKDLSVNLARINFSQKRYLKQPRRYLENDLSAEKLNGKSDLEDSVVSDKAIIKEKSTSDDFKASRETSVKSKRKSVSFAEDKNVEIEYSPIRPKIISRRASTINVREKLSFDDKAESDEENETTEASEKHANTDDTKSESESYDSDKLPDRSDVDVSNKELDDSTENNEEMDEQNVENKSLNSDTPRKRKVAKKIGDSSDDEAEDVVEKQSTSKKKKILKRNRPKPLSKKIKAKIPKEVNISEDIAESDEENETTEASKKHANTEDTKSESESYDSDKLPDRSDVSNKELDDSTENNEESDEQSVGNKSLKSDTPRKTNLAKKIADSSDDEAEDVIEKKNTSKKKKIPKRDRPKPLSKKMRDINISEDTERASPILSKRKESIDSGNISSDKDANEKIISKNGTEIDDNDSVRNDDTEKDKEELLDNNENVDTSEEVKENEQNEDENCRTSKKSSADLDAQNDEKEDEDSSLSMSSETTKLKVNSVRPKPGPLSKKKKALEAARACTNLSDSEKNDSLKNDPTSEPSEVGSKTESPEAGSSKSRDEPEKTEENQPIDDSKKTDEAFMPVDRNLDDENKESDEEPSKTDTESPIVVDNDESNSFTDAEKAEELGITEHDKDNINSILSGLALEESESEDKTVTEKDNEKCEKFEDAENSDGNCGNKRKLSDDDDGLNATIDKKKKKVTFCEDAT